MAFALGRDRRTDRCLPGGTLLRLSAVPWGPVTCSQPQPAWEQRPSWSMSLAATLQAGTAIGDPGCAKAAPRPGTVQHGLGTLPQNHQRADPAPTPQQRTPTAASPSALGSPAGAGQAQPGQGATKQLLPRRGYKKPRTYCWWPQAPRGQASCSAEEPRVMCWGYTGTPTAWCVPHLPRDPGTGRAIVEVHISWTPCLVRSSIAVDSFLITH